MKFDDSIREDYEKKLKDFPFESEEEAKKYNSKNVIIKDSFTALETPFCFGQDVKKTTVVKKQVIEEYSSEDSSDYENIESSCFYGDIEMDIDLFVNNKQLVNTELILERNKKYGLVGRNGIGKTSLLKAIKKKEFGINKDLKIHMIKQDYVSDKKVKDFVGFDGKILQNLGFTKDMLELSLRSLSGGWRMRAQLARAIFKNPDLLMLDEPTNFLDIRGINWLEKQIPNLKTVIIVSHDRNFLNNTVDNILFLDDCKIRVYKGNYASFKKQRDQTLATQIKEYENQQAEIQHIQSFINRFRANAARSSQAQSRIKVLEKMKIIEMPKVDPKIKFRFSSDFQKGILIDIDNLNFSYESKIEMRDLADCLINNKDNNLDESETNKFVKKNLIFENLDFKVTEKSRIVIVGENGQGKSTFLKLLTGKIKPVSGNIILHQKAKIKYFAQHHVDHLDLEQNTISYLMKNYDEETSRAALSNFGLHVKNQKIGTLSGGQKSRLAFAAIALAKPNVLIFDEPTNHLDMETIDALADALVNFQGAVIAVSHDLAFIEKVFDEVYVCENKTLRLFKGSVTDYKDSLEIYR